MSDALTRVPSPSAPPSTPAPDASRAKSVKSDAVLCERCSTEMFRMHAVWRCPNCGFKTDCCGW